MSKWLVILEAEVEASSIAEAREKAIGSFGNFNNLKKIRRLEFHDLEKEAKLKKVLSSLRLTARRVKNRLMNSDFPIF